MAAAQVAPLLTQTQPKFETADDRRATMNSVLGTMTAEGEMPSKFALSCTEQYVAGEITFEQWNKAVLDHAFRMAHEASLGHAGR